MTKRVLVAMSGGVDSSVAACLLTKEGYEVIGVTMDLLTSSCRIQRFDTCCGLLAFEDARKVAEKIGIPHYILDIKDEFEKKVIVPFMSQYLNGRTPNPCILCNEKIKFGSLLEKAKGLCADYIATGHYARVEYDKSNKRYLLKKGIDEVKDQSYFLFSLSQEQLAHCLFPLGDYTKNKVRQLAEEFGLKVHNKPDSQEICFIPDNNYQEFIRQRAKNQLVPGDILGSDGNIIGRHEGIAFYTIGQRRGLKIATGKPLYVIRIDPNRNAIIVGDKDLLYSRRLMAEAINWVSVSGITTGTELMAKIRYLHKGVKAFVSPFGSVRSPNALLPDNDMVSVEFDEPQQAITPGQAVVFYDNEIVLGGGWIC